MLTSQSLSTDHWLYYRHDRGQPPPDLFIFCLNGIFLTDHYLQFLIWLL